MSPAAPAIPMLRLAHARSPAATAVMLRSNRPAQPASRPHQVRQDAGKSVAIPFLPAADPRWVLAVRAAGQLQGGRSALLTPERRRSLLVLAGRMGLRPFDASLVIAIVQDAARAGQDPLGSITESRLALVPTAPTGQPQPTPVAGLFIASLSLAAGIFLGLMAWLGAV